MSERLASGVMVAALLRRVAAEGGFGTVLHRGDATAGAIAIVTRDRGGSRLIERVMAGAGGYEWREAAAGASIDSWIERARRFDSDLWVIELDIADAARFVAEMSPAG